MTAQAEPTAPPASLVPLADVQSRLLEHLRQITGSSELGYAAPPEPIGGGFSGASIYGFQLTGAPPELSQPLVLRVLMGEAATDRQRREAALQDAAGRLGCTVPRIHLTGSAEVGLGGAFFVMDRLEGRTLMPWLGAPLALSLPLCFWLGAAWPLLAGYLLGAALVGVTMAVHQRRLFSLSHDAVEPIYREHGLSPADVDVGYWLDTTEESITEGALEGFRPGLEWLRQQRPPLARPVLCHGDIQPMNFMATWTRVTGLIDWEIACIAEPELDVAVVRCDVVLLPGPYLGTLFFPVYLAYSMHLRAHASLDPERLRYYEALRTLLMVSAATGHHIATQALKRDGADEVPGPDMPPFFMRMLIRAHTRRFEKLTGVRLEAPKEAFQ